MRYSLFALALLFFAPSAAQALTPAEVDALVKELDERQRNSGDWKARAYMEQKEKDKNDVVYDAVVYRRDEKDQFMILFLRPKAERGKGYLRIDKNLWFYDPRVGKWERRTERERIGGTDSNRADFDESRLSEEFTAKWLRDGTLGKFQVHEIELVAKPGVDVAYPKLRLWIDQTTHVSFKEQAFAASVKLMRTSYFPKWQKLFSQSKGQEVWYPKEMRFFDEIEKGNRTTVLIREVDLNTLPANIFTKAWLEAKSR